MEVISLHESRNRAKVVKGIGPVVDSFTASVAFLGKFRELKSLSYKP